MTATDTLGGSGSKSYAVTILPALAIATATLANGDVSTSYSHTVFTTGGTGSATFSQTSGTLPLGLTFSTSGVISGTPTTVGAYTFTVTATDTLGATATQSYTVTINPAVTIATTTLANGDVHGVYSQTIFAANGSGSYTLSQTGGTLPGGLTLASTGVLSGSPTLAGNYSFAVTATDTLGGRRRSRTRLPSSPQSRSRRARFRAGR